MPMRNDISLPAGRSTGRHMATPQSESSGSFAWMSDDRVVVAFYFCELHLLIAIGLIYLFFG